MNGECHGRQTFDSANSICAGSSSRLCTKEELAADCAINSGCDNDHQHLWTSTRYLADSSLDGEPYFKIEPTSMLELWTNFNQDLTVIVNDVPLVTTQKYTINNDDQTAVKIQVRKNASSSRFVFPSVPIFLRSSCRDTAHPMEVTANIWNLNDDSSQTKHIKFTAPCPRILLAGDMKHSSKMRLNRDVLTSKSGLIDVTIFNPDYQKWSLYDRSMGNLIAPPEEKILDDVVLMFRQVGDVDWKEGVLKDDLGRQTDFSAEMIQDDFGYAKLSWDVNGVQDSLYQVTIMSRCSSQTQLLPVELQKHNTNYIEITLDRRELMQLEETDGQTTEGGGDVKVKAIESKVDKLSAEVGKLSTELNNNVNSLASDLDEMKALVKQLIGKME